MRSASSYFNFKLTTKALAIALFFLFASFTFTKNTFAAAGINRQINFQGKVVNKTAGTNVANGAYPMVFTIYDKASGGTALWTENDSSVTVTDGIFRVGLGATTAFPAGFNFNQDGLFLDITFNSEAMGSRIQLTAVPYAFNAGQVAGLTVQDSTSGAASTSATLKLGDATTPRTFDLGANSLTFTTSGTTTLTLPTSGTVTALGNTTTGSGSTLVLSSNPSLVGLTLSSGGITLGGTVSDSSHCIVGGATAAWGTCGSGGSGGSNWTLGAGFLTPNNSTVDLLVGGQATTSAKFAILGVNGARGTQTASISGSISLDSSTAALQSTLSQSLTLGGDKTGDIFLAPKSSAGTVFINTTGLGLNTYSLVVAQNTNAVAEFVNTGSLSSTGGAGMQGHTNAYPTTGDQRVGFLTFGSNVAGVTKNAISIEGFSTGAWSSGDTASYLIFDTTPAGSSTRAERVRITSAGLFGIGTTGPASELHVTRALSVGATGVALATFDQIENQDIIAASKSGARKFTVDQNGNLGLATSIPTSGNYITAPNFSVTTGGVIAAATSNTINSVSINAGAVSGITTLSMNNQLTNTLSTGTAPFAITSTTRVANLNVDLLDGIDSTGFCQSGGSGCPAGTNYFTRTAGNIFPTTLNDTIAATSSASTVATFTSNGTIANNTLIQAGTAGTTTSLLNLTQASGATVTNGLAFTGTFTNLINAGSAFTVTNAGAGTFGGLLTGNAGITVAGGGANINSTGTSSTNLGNTTGIVSLNSGNTSFWSNLSGNLTIQTVTSGTMAVDSAGALNLGITNSTSTSLGKAATTLTVNPTAWTATPTISGLITATSGLTSNGTLIANGVVTLGDNGDNFSVDSNAFDVSTAGALSGITTLSMNNQLTSTLSTGTAPFVVASTTRVANLNADLLDGIDSTGFCQSGGSGCPAGNANYWNLVTGAGGGYIAPVNGTTDFLAGFGTGAASTASAKFAFLNAVGAGNPTASVSAQNAGGTAVFLDSTGFIQGTRNNTLTLGGDKTGNIAISPNNGGAGSLLTVNSLTTTFSGTTVMNATALTNLNVGSLGTVDAAASLGIDSTTLTLGGGSAATITTTTNGLTLDSGSNTLTIATSDTALTASGLGTFTTAASLGITATTLTLGNGSAATITTTTNGLTLDSGSNTLTVASSDTTLTASGLTTLNTAATLALSGDLTITGNDITNATLNLGNGSAATVGTVSDDDLSLAPNGSGNINLSGDFDTQVLIGASGATTEFPLLVKSGIGNNAALAVDNRNNGDIFTASASGTTKFVLDTNGQLKLLGGQTSDLDTLTATTLKLGASTANAITLGNSTITSTTFNVDTAGNFIFQKEGAAFACSGTDKLTLNVTGQLICSTDATGGAGGGGSNWTLSTANGTLSPNNNTLDLFIGGTATSSSKFGFLNVNSGTPTASISGNSGTKALSLLGTGQIQTTQNNTLTLGGDKTGNIVLSPLNNGTGGNVGIATSNPLTRLDIGSNTALDEIVTIRSQLASGIQLLADTDNAGGEVGNPYVYFAMDGTVNSGYIGMSQAPNEDPLGNAVTGGNGNELMIGSNNPTTGANSVGFFVNNLAMWTIRNDGTIVHGNGTTTPLASLDLRAQNGHTPIASLSGTTTAATLLVDQRGTGNIFTASTSGVPKFTIDNSGNITDNGTTITAVNLSTLTAGTTFAINASSTINTNQTNLTLFNSTATTLSFAGAASTLSMGASAGTLNLGNGGNYTLATTSNGNLNLTTGGTGKIGVYSSTPRANFDVAQDTASGATSGTVATASVSGKTSFAALVANNSGIGDIFTASSSGITRLRVSNNGSVLFQGDTLASTGSYGAAGTASEANQSAVINALGDEGSLVPNAGFESNITVTKTTNTSDPVISDGWVSVASASAAVTRIATDSAKGTSSVFIKLNTNEVTGIISPCIAISNKGAYTLNYYAKASVATRAVVRGNLIQFTTKGNCQTNTTSTLSSVDAANNLSTTNWTKIGTGTTAIAGLSATVTWARVRINVSAPTGAVNVNIDGVRLIESDTGQGVDYAENYQGDPNNLAKSGDVVSMTQVDGKTLVVPANKYMDKATLGVVSTNPGMVLDDGTIDVDLKIPVALAGRIPTKVSTANGEIKAGDALTSSPIPGVAVKSTKAGITIGTAMEDYSEIDPGKVGKIVMFVKNSYSDGVPQEFTQNQDSMAVLNSLVAQRQNPENVYSSVINTDKVIAGLEIITPKITADEIDVKKLRVGQIEGLELITDKISSLNDQVAKLSASASGAPVKSADQSLQEKLLEQLRNASASATQASNASSQISLDSDGIATVSGNLRVKGSGLFEGILTVLDTLTTNNLIANGVSNFFGDVFFKGNVSIEGNTTFGNDVGGDAVIKKDAKRVEIVFDKEFEEMPIVNASVSFEEQKDKQGNVVSSDDLEQAYFDQGYSYIIVNKSTKGFTLVLNKKAKDNITFTWTALRVKDAKTIQSRASN